jgi:signal peptide peptidase SppA
MDVLMHDESVKGVILDIFSPGGMAYGAPELAEKIFSYRGTKPIIAVANPMAASGAYWLAAAADRVVMTPSGDVGSVGVLWEHISFSEANEREGIKATVIRSTDSPYKAEGTDLEPLSDEAKQNMQMRADEIHARFVSDLARFRGVTAAHVLENFGKGRVVDAKRAVQAGMVDKVMTLQEVVGKLGAGRIRLATQRAEDNWDSPTLREQKLQRAAALRAIAEEPEGDAE